MALLDNVKAMCDRLAPAGWRELLKRVTGGQLDIRAGTRAAFRRALTEPLGVIDRTVPGFGDFSLDGHRGITAGSPSASLLYHAVASPGVTGGLTAFPTLREIEAVENFVFGIEPPTLRALRTRVGAADGRALAVVIFAYEYRPARDTCARVQADLVFSRTGVARVGTREPLYDPRRRGFQAEVAEDPFAFRVCPARYGAFLAVRVTGGPARSVPMRPVDGDARRPFWLPVHKLFDGPECLAGVNVRVQLSTFHYNDKIRRTRAVSLKLARVPRTAPFQFSDGIAELTGGPDLCQGLVVPVAHPRLIEPAAVNGRALTFRVPPAESTFAAFEPGADEDAATGAEIRPAPAYVHARTQVRDGVLIDLNNDPTRPDVRQTVSRGRYHALHYVDFTGDGRIEGTVPAVTGRPGVARATVPAYSLVAAPDFFPEAGQRELREALPRKRWGVEPVPLSDTRLPANLQMPGNRFGHADRTMTALVPLWGPAPSGTRPPRSADASRHSWLPDDCAGVFAPGWDVSTDRARIGRRRVHHLAAYGLGSPFPEDSKLCAALGTFWPAVAPDATRGMSPTPGNADLRATIAPLTDEEIGQVGSLPWDGVPGPTVVTLNGQAFVECASFISVDYVTQALDRRFTLRLTGRVSSEEYARRVEAMGLVYDVLGGNRNRRFVLSFRHVDPGDAELQQAQIDASLVLPGPVHRVDLIRGGADTERPHPTDPRRRLLPILDRRLFLVDSVHGLVLQRGADQPHWNRATLPS